VEPIRRAAITYAVYFTAIGASFAYLPVYYRGLGLDLATVGLLSALSATIQLVAAPGWGALADRFPGSRLGLPAAALVAAAGATLVAVVGATMVVATAPTVIVLAGGIAVLAVGLAGIGPVLDSRTLELLGADRQRYGQVRAVGSIAFVGVTSLVGFLLDQRGLGALFLVYVPALVATAVVSLAVPRRGASRRPGILRGLGLFLRTPGVGLFMAGAILTWLLLNGVNGFYSIQVVALGGSAQIAGLTWVVGALFEIPVMWGYQRLAARFGAGRLLVVGATVFAIRAGLGAVAPDASWLLAISPLEGLGFGLFYVGGVSFVAARAPAGLAATAQGVFAATLGLGTIFGTGLGGLLAGALSIGGLFAVAAGGGLVAALVVAVAARSSTRGSASVTASPGPSRVAPEEVTR
jgi:PPP family 3-phenylpropionic acid transporter